MTLIEANSLQGFTVYSPVCKYAHTSTCQQQSSLPHLYRWFQHLALRIGTSLGRGFDILKECKAWSQVLNDLSHLQQTNSLSTDT